MLGKSNLFLSLPTHCNKDASIMRIKIGEVVIFLQLLFVFSAAYETHAHMPIDEACFLCYDMLIYVCKGVMSL